MRRSRFDPDAETRVDGDDGAGRLVPRIDAVAISAAGADATSDAVIARSKTLPRADRRMKPPAPGRDPTEGAGLL